MPGFVVFSVLFDGVVGEYNLVLAVFLHVLLEDDPGDIVQWLGGIQKLVLRGYAPWVPYDSVFLL